jgi:hypothetical protein
MHVRTYEVPRDLRWFYRYVGSLRQIVIDSTCRKAVLAVGNALNGYTFRGNARGFQLESLIKVRDNIVPCFPDG